MLAFNPAGVDQADAANPVTGNSGDTNRGGESVESDARDEGYLYWLGWVVNNTVSLHSTSDAEGPLRRVGVIAQLRDRHAAAAPERGRAWRSSRLQARSVRSSVSSRRPAPRCCRTSDELPDLPGPLSTQRGGAEDETEEGTGEGEEETPAPAPRDEEQDSGEGLELEAEPNGEGAPDAPLEIGEGSEGEAG